ncbi:hypothetical protein SAMD00019534_044700 [Acytostelium subglobosum LB1]|uniref:hypothetical protein n=1 Tax=Acytostelium subglobosum LB1 TaxID=1410327 RepID=UPI000644A733|nr:hypothetical protein SAMD00019534_044700 [Acytostelium subglobosum LB1]GAM21295.1 hypothetical protein SAMD00019534_044700 [Acytostelium subglobosum LB1]|eukprot:XP_012755414.1 hypothetical protein SAMD00019534_044700 [Acytostelium subglobosum LB1]
MNTDHSTAPPVVQQQQQHQTNNNNNRSNNNNSVINNNNINNNNIGTTSPSSTSTVNTSTAASSPAAGSSTISTTTTTTSTTTQQPSKPSSRRKAPSTTKMIDVHTLSASEHGNNSTSPTNTSSSTATSEPRVSGRGRHNKSRQSQQQQTQSQQQTDFDPSTNEVFIYHQGMATDGAMSQPSSSSSSTASQSQTQSSGLTWQQEQMLGRQASAGAAKLNPKSPPFMPSRQTDNNSTTSTSSSTTSSQRDQNNRDNNKRQANKRGGASGAGAGAGGERGEGKPSGERQPRQQQQQQDRRGHSSPLEGKEKEKDQSNGLKDKFTKARENAASKQQQPRQQQQSDNGDNNGDRNKRNTTASTSQPKYIFDDKDATKTADYTPLAIQIINKLQSNNYDCMVCYEAVKRTAPVWNCPSCSTIFHQSCIKVWMTKSTTPDGKWKCPGCRHIVERGEPQSTCFCGKQRDPQYNPYFLPHSCGEVCGKLRAKSNCPHTCNILCHPGPCLNCSALGPMMKCHCRRTEYRLMCGEVDKGKCCDNVCDKPLSCGNHQCANTCHPGECSPCQVLETQKCYCGKTFEKRPCGSGTRDPWNEEEDRLFSCQTKCDRFLDCGKHKCTRTCHTGPCDPCELVPDKVTRCCCSQTALVDLPQPPRESCLEPVPTCPKVCSRVLPCGQHPCQEKCHSGPCPPCRVKVRTACRCGKSVENRQCGMVQANLSTSSAAFTCSSVCHAMRACKKHECGVKCCPATATNDPVGNHVCKIVCGRTLKCGLHKCEQLCHQGKCYPCPFNSYDEMSCRCGKTVMLPPIPCGTRMQQCPHPCTVRRECGHTDEIAQHQCHQGPCPPCPVLVEKLCASGHEIRKNIKCHTTEVSCGKACGKTLPCLVHRCPRTCHNGLCLKPSTSGNGSSTPPQTFDVFADISCGYPCGAKLKTCEHSCQAPCHPGEPCPAQVCKQKTKIFCPCERRCVETICVPISADGNVRELECDEVCEQEKRDKLFLSLKSDAPPEATPEESEPPTMSQLELLTLYSKASPRSVRKLETIFDEFINSSVLKLTVSFKDSIQSNLIMNMARYYHLRPREKRGFNTIELYKVQKLTAIPVPLLTESLNFMMLSSVTKSTQSYASISLNSIVTEKYQAHTLLIYNLDLSIKSEHIQQHLKEHADKYQLLWVDDSNLLVVFDDLHSFEGALNTKVAMFSVMPYADDPSLIEVLQSNTVKRTDTASPTSSFFTNRFAYLDSPFANNMTSTTTTTTTTTTSSSSGRNSLNSSLARSSDYNHSNTGGNNNNNSAQSEPVDDWENIQ